ncbi:MAG: DUF3318 domain-containing protein [Cyanobacteriota bacterium]|nr:DUF3318 domain-containing protein [Cyanobacteriota bacterium]
MNPDQEIRRLFDLMPASGRMMTKIVSGPAQSKVIDSPFPLPWKRDRSITINFDRWGELPQPQRDLLLLRTVSWLIAIKWFQPDLSRGIIAAGVVGTFVELFQGDAVGIVAAAGLTALAAQQIWRRTRSSESELTADEAAIEVARRRGYNKTEAARYLLNAIEAVARMEGRPSLNFTELLRCQNLRAISGVSSVGVPNGMRQEG